MRYILILLVSLFLWAPAYAGGITVTEQHFAVQLSTGSPHTMAGFLYERKGGKKTKPLQVLVHGLTYNHTYWDTPRINGRQYSYARFMAQRGYDVLALDALGTGKSTIPNGDVLNLQESALVLAQVLTRLQADHPKIALVGHSVGTIASVLVMGLSGNALADVLVATGWSYAPHVVGLDPVLIGQLLTGPFDYGRFPASERERLFYYLPRTDLAVLAFDQANLADQFPRGIITQGLPLLEALALGDEATVKALSLVDQVTVPVLVQLGEFDLEIAPPRFPRVEKALYASSPDVTVDVVRQIGHSFNQHQTRLRSWSTIARWLKSRLRRVHD